ncbi:MAG: M20/M25/M40 family metallo-hydrolase [Acidobacteriota bacterium]|nr:M20/M25/M40 family metallo-hydrolase [Blastocatellia bacterium]MDW8412953.1 M20/M25/M40 family metallo-hydrolase [Acidobacteriota bacterium]
MFSRALVIAFVVFAFQLPVFGSDEASVVTDNLLRHVKVLSSDEFEGRRSGTRGCEQAAEYIASEFRKLGLKPVGEGYYQNFEFVAGVKTLKARCKLKAAGRRIELRLGEDFQPLNFSSSTKYVGSVALAGFGIKADELGYNDFSIDLRKKAALVLPYSPEGNNPHGKFAPYLAIRRKALSARESGVGVVLFISEAETLSERVLRRDETYTDAGVAAILISRKVADFILSTIGKTVEQLQKEAESSAKGQLSELPKVSLELELSLIRESRTTANVVGLLEGETKEYLLIGAHYDHLGLGGSGSLAPDRQGVHHGADDNASGVAGLLELARIMSLQNRLKRGIVFAAFSGEEEGLLGSAYYAKHPLVPIEQTVAMLNMDMIGRMRDDRLVIGGAGTSTGWKKLVDGANSLRGLQISYQDDGYGPSDHASFYAQNVPVLFFFTGNHEDYHKPSDTYDKINYLGMKTILALVRDVALAVVNAELRPTFTKAGEADTRRATNTFRVVLGTVPDYSSQVEGMRLSGVRPGSPAEQAGLRSGDVIVELAGRRITSIHDYTYVLQDLRPGQTVSAIVLRDGKRLEFKVTPAARP